MKALRSLLFAISFATVWVCGLATAQIRSVNEIPQVQLHPVWSWMPMLVSSDQVGVAGTISLLPMPDGGVIVGSIESLEHVGFTRLDRDGRELWRQIVEVPTFVSALSASSVRNYLYRAANDEVVASAGEVILRLAATGAVRWRVDAEDIGMEYVGRILVLGDDSVLVAGIGSYSARTGANGEPGSGCGPGQATLARLSSAGRLRWFRHYCMPFTDRGGALPVLAADRSDAWVLFAESQFGAGIVVRHTGLGAPNPRLLRISGADGRVMTGANLGYARERPERRNTWNPVAYPTMDRQIAYFDEPNAYGRATPWGDNSMASAESLFFGAIIDPRSGGTSVFRVVTPRLAFIESGRECRAQLYPRQLAPVRARELHGTFWCEYEEEQQPSSGREWRGRVHYLIFSGDLRWGRGRWRRITLDSNSATEQTGSRPWMPALWFSDIQGGWYIHDGQVGRFDLSDSRRRH